MSARGPNKPRFTLREWLRLQPFLREIRDHLSRYPQFWQDVASDVLDGWATDDDVRPLVRQRLLKRIPSPNGGYGLQHTWDLTERGLRLLSPSHQAALGDAADGVEARP